MPAGAADAFEEAVQDEAYGALLRAEAERAGARSLTSQRALQALSRRSTVADPHSPSLRHAGKVKIIFGWILHVHDANGICIVYMA